jgi:hypothetical protein
MCVYLREEGRELLAPCFERVGARRAINILFSDVTGLGVLVRDRAQGPHRPQRLRLPPHPPPTTHQQPDPTIRQTIGGSGCLVAHRQKVECKAANTDAH